jgi:hypothetical protein
MGGFMKVCWRLAFLFLAVCSGVIAGEIEMKPEFLSSHNDSLIGSHIAKAFGYKDDRLYLLATDQEVVGRLKADSATKIGSATGELLHVSGNAGLKLFCLLGCSGNGADDTRARTVRRAVLNDQTTPAELSVDINIPEIRAVPFDHRVGTCDIEHVFYQIDLSGLSAGAYTIQVFENHQIIEEDVTKPRGANRKLVSETRTPVKTIHLTID